MDRLDSTDKLHFEITIASGSDHTSGNKRPSFPDTIYVRTTEKITARGPFKILFKPQCPFHTLNLEDRSERENIFPKSFLVFFGDSSPWTAYGSLDDANKEENPITQPTCTLIAKSTWAVPSERTDKLQNLIEFTQTASGPGELLATINDTMHNKVTDMLSRLYLGNSDNGTSLQNGSHILKLTKGKSFGIQQNDLPWSTSFEASFPALWTAKGDKSKTASDDVLMTFAVYPCLGKVDLTHR